MPSAIAPGAASTQSKIIASLMTPDQTPEPPNRANAMQQRLRTLQNIRKNPRVSGPSSGGSVVQETPHIDATTAELHPNAFNDDTSSLDNNDNENHIDIDFQPPPNAFYLNMYKTVTQYLFKFKDPTSSQKISIINKKITKNNVETGKQKLDYLIPLEIIMQTIDLYE